MKFQFIQDHREDFPVRLMCRVLEASPSGFYDWRRRPESPRAAEDQALVAKIQVVHSESRQTYGSPRVHASLKAEGYRIGRNRVARLIRDRLALGQNAQAQVVGVDFEPVDLVVGLDRAVGEVAVTRDQRLDAARDHFFDLGTHQQQLIAQLAQFVFVLPVGVLALQHACCHPNPSAAAKRRRGIHN